MSAQRWVRAGSLVAAVLVLSLAGHTLVGGGALPDLMGVLVGVIVVAAVATVLSSHRQSVLVLFGAVLGLQGLLHVVFHVTAAHHAAMGVMPSTSMLLGHALAAACAVWLLRSGDALAMRWLRFFATVFCGSVTVCLPCMEPPRFTLRHRSPSTFLNHDVVAHLSHRGPPSAVIAL